MEAERVAVTIPVYKEELSESEKISLLQCLNILEKYPIILFAPEGLDLNNYLKIFTEKKVDCSVKCFDKSYFQNIEGYNRFMLSKEFYESFEAYNYILIYQLDAYVFRDELLEWCKKGYDYIGAPILKKGSEDEFLEFSGNGGFSLRKVSSHIRVLKSKKIIYSFGELFKGYGNPIKALLMLPYICLRMFGFKNNVSFLLQDFGRNEDAFWNSKASSINENFRVAPFNESRFFAFEKKSRYLYELNKNELPFGCHAFEKHEPEFWRSFIKY